jgi:hypothetical protein
LFFFGQFSENFKSSPNFWAMDKIFPRVLILTKKNILGDFLAIFGDFWRLLGDFGRFLGDFG